MTARDTPDQAVTEPTHQTVTDPAGAPAPSPSGGRGPDQAHAGRHRAGAKPRSLLVELPILVVVALLLALLVKTFLVQAFYIPSGSMENTLQIGDRVVVDKITYHFRSIHRGDIVVFNGLDSFDPEVTSTPPSNPVARALRWVGSAIGVAPPGEKDYIKRVIGVPGDVVSCCDAHGRVEVNGVGLTEPYVFDNTPLALRRFAPVKVPPGKLWVMGDHRGDSSDSRIHGPVPSSKVVGRAFLVVWPLSHWQLLQAPSTFAGPALVHASPPALPRPATGAAQPTGPPAAAGPMTGGSAASGPATGAPILALSGLVGLRRTGRRRAGAKAAG